MLLPHLCPVARCRAFCLAALIVVGLCTGPNALAQNSISNYAPQAGDLDNNAELFRLAPTRKVTVTAPTNGTVGRFRWRLGDHIEAGEAIVVLQSDRLRLELERGLGNFHRAYLSQQMAGEQSEAEQEINSLAARAAVSELREVFHKIRRLTVTAPFSGRIEQVHIADGELLRAGQPVLRLVETDYVQLRLPVDTRQVLVGQELCVLFAKGRVSGTVLDVLPSSQETAPYTELVNRLGVAVLLLPNSTGALDIGSLGVVPAHPFALLPSKYAATLKSSSPLVTVQKEAEPVTDLPIELIGPFGPEYSLAIGPFQDGEVLVEVTTAATAEAAAVTKPVENAVVFPVADPLLTNDQFESGFPALAQKLPLLAGDAAADADSNNLAASAELPSGVEGILFPLEYPLTVADSETLQKRFGLERKNLPIVETIRSYFEQEVNRKRLAVRTIDELKYATASGSLKDYVDVVGEINDELLAVLLAVSETDNETLFGRMLTAYGAEAILEAPGPELLELQPDQLEQIERMQDSFEQQRQSLFEQYLDGNLPIDQYRATSRQALDAWRQDLALVLTPEQRTRLAELTPAAAIPNAANAEADSPKTDAAVPTGETAEEDEEAPTRRLKIPELKQESALLPFLILGGGVVVVLILLVVGYIIYRKRSS